MNDFPTGTLVTMHGTHQPGHIVRTRNSTHFEYDIQLEDGTLIEATSHFWHAVPSVYTPIRDIPDCVSVETGQRVQHVPGLAFIDCYYLQGEELERRWKKYRERYPLDPYGVLWGYASHPDGLLNEQERAQYEVVAENRQRWCASFDAKEA